LVGKGQQECASEYKSASICHENLLSLLHQFLLIGGIETMGVPRHTPVLLGAQIRALGSCWQFGAGFAPKARW
jgi:hypothetical protein